MTEDQIAKMREGQRLIEQHAAASAIVVAAPGKKFKLITRQRYADGSFPDSWEACIETEDIGAWGKTEAEARQAVIEVLYDKHRRIFNDVATVAEKVELGREVDDLELCENCGDDPVYLSAYCRQCCAEKGLKGGPDREDED